MPARKRANYQKVFDHFQDTLTRRRTQAQRPTRKVSNWFVAFAPVGLLHGKSRILASNFYRFLCLFTCGRRLRVRSRMGLFCVSNPLTSGLNYILLKLMISSLSNQVKELLMWDNEYQKIWSNTWYRPIFISCSHIYILLHSFHIRWYLKFRMPNVRMFSTRAGLWCNSTIRCKIVWSGNRNCDT